TGVGLAQGRGREGVVDTLEKGSDLVRRRGISSRERRSKGGRVAEGLAPGEIVAKETRHDQVVAPPLLGTGDGIAHRRARLGGEEIFKRGGNGPRVELLKKFHHCAGALGAVGAALESGERGTRKRPIGPQRVLHHRVDGHLRVLQQRDSFPKLRLVLKLARVRQIGGERSVDRLKAVQARGQGSGRGIAWRRRRAGRRAKLEPPCVRPRDLPACPRREPKPEGQTEDDSDEMLQASHPAAAQLWRAGRAPSLMGSTYCRSMSQGK